MTRTTEDLQVHIDKAHLVKALGGTSDWTWEYPPVVPGENAAQLCVEFIKQGYSELIISLSP